MKKLIAPLAIIATLALAGCSSSDDPTQASGESAQPTATAPAQQEQTSPAETEQAAPDLTGTWKQTNSNSETDYQQATITDDTISIDWVSDDGDTTSIYWVGTFVAPTDAADSFVVTSERDKEATDTALLASTDDTKDFTFEDGVLSYKLSALGTTMTVKMEKQ
ncbi:MAG: hypothetical protein NVV57_00245 [Demequina sp.]|nr:hypothetical protein [Demequina sp.]